MRLVSDQRPGIVSIAASVVVSISVAVAVAVSVAAGGAVAGWGVREVIVTGCMFARLEKGSASEAVHSA